MNNDCILSNNYGLIITLEDLHYSLYNDKEWYESSEHYMKFILQILDTPYLFNDKINTINYNTPVYVALRVASNYMDSNLSEYELLDYINRKYDAVETNSIHEFE